MRDYIGTIRRRCSFPSLSDTAVGHGDSRTERHEKKEEVLSTRKNISHELSLTRVLITSYMLLSW